MTTGWSIAGAVLRTLSVLQGRCPKIGTDGLTVFLHVCQNEGIGVKELTYLCRMSDSRVSRALKVLRVSGDKSAPCRLIQLIQHSGDRRCVRVFLAEDGIAIRDEINSPRERFASAIPKELCQASSTL